MGIHSYAKALDTVAWFLGDDGWSIAQPLLVERMKRDKIIGFGFHRHNGSFYRISLETPYYDFSITTY